MTDAEGIEKSKQVSGPRNGVHFCLLILLSRDSHWGSVSVSERFRTGEADDMLISGMAETSVN
jgi:hypothetical protein